MTLRHMKIFCAICENDFNTTRTAEILNMTQPAVSLAIKELEQYYGILLFERIGRRLQITEVGRQFLEYAVHISSLFDDMEKKIKDWDYHGIIRVGASITIGSQFLPSYVKAFSAQFPNIEIKVTIATSEQLENKILMNELDFALIEGNVHHSSIISEEYMEDQLSVICSSKGKYHQGDIISIDTFKQEKFLLRENGSGTRETFDYVINNAGFTVSPVWEAMSTTALVNAVISGLGIAVLPHRMIVGPLERGLIHTIQVENLSFRRSFNIIHHKDKYLTSSLKSFIELCKNYEMDYPLPKYNGLY